MASTPFAPGDSGAPAAAAAKGGAGARKTDMDRANTQAQRVAELIAEFKQLPKCLGLMNESIAIRPKIARWYATRAQIYRGLGRNQLAFYDLNAAIRLEPRTWQYYCARAICLRKLRRFGDALSEIGQALEGDPTVLVYRFYRGTIWMHMENYPQAVADFTAAIAPGEKHAAKSRLLRAACYERLGRTADAMADLRRLASSDNASAAAVNALGVALCELGQYEESIDVFTLASERAYSNPMFGARALDNRSWAEFHIGKFRAALETNTQCILQGGDERSNDPAPLVHKGAILLAMGYPLKALPELLRAAELSEALVRKEARRAARDTTDATAALDAASEAAGSAPGGGGGGGGGGTRSTGTGTGGGRRTAALRRQGLFDQLAPEAAAAFGEPPPSAFLASAVNHNYNSSGVTGSGSTVLGGGNEDITDSDTYTDAARENDISMQEVDKRSSMMHHANSTGGAQSPSKKSGDTTSRPTTGDGGGGGNKKEGGGDDKSDNESVRSGSTGAGTKSMRKVPAARNLGRAAPRSKLPGAASAPKPWSVVPSWVKERPWPEEPMNFTVPHTRSLCTFAATVQAYVGMCYESLGHAERALHHYRSALLAWPSFVPAQYHAGLMLHQLHRYAESDAILSQLLDETAHIHEEVEVVPPGLGNTQMKTSQSLNKRDDTDGMNTTTSSFGNLNMTGTLSNTNTTTTTTTNGVFTSPAENSLWSPTESRSAIIRLGISALELIPPHHPSEPRPGYASGGGGAAAATGAGEAVAPDAAAAAGADTAGAGGGGEENAGGGGGEEHPNNNNGDDQHENDSGGAQQQHHITPAVPDTPLQAAIRRCRARVYLARGLARQEQGLHAQAATDLTLSLRDDPSIGESYYRRAASYIAISKARVAISDCKVAIQRGRNTATTRDMLGQAYAYIGDYPSAISEFTSALRLSPDTPIFLSRRASAHQALGDIAAAMKDTTAALLVAANNAEILCQRGDVQYQGNDFTAALVDYKSALAIVLGTAQQHEKQQQQYELLEHNITKKLSTGHFTALLHYKCGLALSNLDKYADSLVSFTSALNILEPLCGARANRGGGGGDGSASTGAGSSSSSQQMPSLASAFGGEVMSKSLAAALATASLRMNAPKLRVPKSFHQPGDEADDEGDDVAGGKPANSPLPLSGGVGAALRGLATKGAMNAPGGVGASSAFKGAASKWVHKAKVHVTPGISSAALRAAEEAAAGGLIGNVPTRLTHARERYLTALAYANATSSFDMVKLRIAVTHERAKTRQMLGQHREAIVDFSEVLASCPDHAHALFRRALSWKGLKDYTTAAEDFETAKSIAPPELQAALSLNYTGIGDVSTLVLCAAGEDPLYPVLGVN